MTLHTKKFILITGGAGYIGSHVAFLLVQHGYHVILLDNLSHGQTWQHTWAPLIVGDVGDTALLASLFEQYPIDTVIHCAASIEVSESIKSPLSYYANNVATTLNLLQLMVHFHIPHFIFSSSCAIYGVPHQVPIVEDHPAAPLSPYGQTKYMVEKILRDCSQAYNLRWVALRYFNAAGAMPEYGLGEYHVPETHVIPRLIHAAQMGSPFTIYGTEYPTPDGTCIRDFTHVIDIAYAHLRALEHLQLDRPSDAFNLGSGQGTSVKQLVTATEQALQTKIKVITEKSRPGDAPILVADHSKATTILNWQPQCSQLSAIIQSAATFMNQHAGQTYKQAMAVR